jgi:cell division protein FtsL
MIQAHGYARNTDSFDMAEPEVKTTTVKRTYKRINRKRVLILKSAALLFTYALVLVYLCIKSATLGYQIVDLQKDIEDLEAANKRMEYNIAQQTSLQRVEEIAQKDLGMCKPDENAIVQIAAQSEPVKSAELPKTTVSQQPATGANTLLKVYQTIAVMAR